MNADSGLLIDSSDLAVRQRLVSAGVRFLMASYVDMHGVSKAKLVPIDHFDQMMAGSEMFTGAALEGVPQSVHDNEVAAHPDASSAVVLPWDGKVAWLASDLWLDDAPFQSCSRSILKRQTAEAAMLGYRFNLGIEAEFYVLRQRENGSIVPLSDRRLSKPCYDGTSALDNLSWLGPMVEAMNGLGWDVYSFDQEDGLGQFEIDFTYADAVAMADRYVFLRMMAGQFARQNGCFASFMPKPYADRTGSGAHFNMSLANLGDGANLFKASDDPRGCGLSKLGYHFLAGVVRHLPAICAVVAPTVNSYKRLVKQGSMSGFTWAPIFAAMATTTEPTRCASPWAAGASNCGRPTAPATPIWAAPWCWPPGWRAFGWNLILENPTGATCTKQHTAELAAAGITELPRTLGEALQAFRADPLSETVMGSAMAKAWHDAKQAEWLEYMAHVSQWEMDRYLKFF